MNKTDRRRSWPAWLASLAPDELARRRMRSHILEEAAGILRARRSGSWWAVTDRWTTRLLPLAAALALVFAGVARRALDAPVAFDTPPTVDELLESASPDGPPAVLTSSVEPGLDQVLSAAVTADAP